MSNKLQVGDVVEGTHGPMRLIADFLPPPEALVIAEEPTTEKITIVLDRETVDFFRQKSQELGASYQRMIRELLKSYASLQSDRTA